MVPDQNIGILAVSCEIPELERGLEEIVGEECPDIADDIQRIGIRNVHLCRSETGSTLALTAARKALSAAGVAPIAVDIIVDYSILPQEYLVPAWNMSNKVQHELGATKSFTIGFSGGGSTNLLVALDFAMATLCSDEEVNTILLLGADVTIPGNRILNPEEPLTVLGDGASAIVVGRTSERNRIRGTHLSTHGGYHDVCYIPGGGMMYPTRDDLYRLRIDVEKYSTALKYQHLLHDVQEVLLGCSSDMNDVKHAVVPNLSNKDRAEYAHSLEIGPELMQPTEMANRGHVQSNDLAFNLHALLEGRGPGSGHLILMCSHGMGFTSGAVLIEH